MKTLKYAIIVVGFSQSLWLLSGCATTDKSRPVTVPAVVKMSKSERDDAARKVADEYMMNFVAAFRDKSIEKFKTVISPERRKELTAEKFQEILDASAREQGKLVDYEPVTVLDQGEFQSYVWKLTYEKLDSEKNPMRRDFLYYVRIGKLEDGRYTIGASGFRL
ncbi:MAG: hypothetical protein LBM70_09360 [Victivallales bacterium]|jgi:hypothetical protein|nr:hypothetical protein [Victivallales bacterium]